jgi:hypothetical protein
VAELITCLEPLVPGSVTRAPGMRPKLTRIQKIKRGFERAGHFAVKAGTVALVLSALLVLSLAGLRARRPPRDRILLAHDASLEMLAMGGGKATGRVETQAAERSLVLQQGLPPEIAVSSFGRISTVNGDTISFANADASEVGRATVPLAWTDGETASIVATLKPPGPAPQLWATTLRRWVMGEAPEPRSVLMLQGDPGRYVAVVATAQHTYLEWSLGERRGTTEGPALQAPETRVELTIGRDGTLKALLGDAKKPVQLGEQVRLGTDWRTALGGTPQPAVACIEAACEFRQVSFEVRLTPPPPPPPPPEPPPVLVADAPKPDPKGTDPKAKDPKAAQKPDPKKPEPKPDPKKPDPKKADPKKLPEPKKIDPAHKPQPPRR